MSPHKYKKDIFKEIKSYGLFNSNLYSMVKFELGETIREIHEKHWLHICCAYEIEDYDSLLEFNNVWQKIDIAEYARKQHPFELGYLCEAIRRQTSKQVLADPHIFVNYLLESVPWAIEYLASVEPYLDPFITDDLLRIARELIIDKGLNPSMFPALHGLRKWTRDDFSKSASNMRWCYPFKTDDKHARSIFSEIEEMQFFGSMQMVSFEQVENTSRDFGWESIDIFVEALSSCTWREFDKISKLFTQRLSEQEQALVIRKLALNPRFLHTEWLARQLSENGKIDQNTKDTVDLRILRDGRYKEANTLIIQRRMNEIRKGKFGSPIFVGFLEELSRRNRGMVSEFALQYLAYASNSGFLVNVDFLDSTAEAQDGH